MGAAGLLRGTPPPRKAVALRAATASLSLGLASTAALQVWAFLGTTAGPRLSILAVCGDGPAAAGGSERPFRPDLALGRCDGRPNGGLGAAGSGVGQGTLSEATAGATRTACQRRPSQGGGDLLGEVLQRDSLLRPAAVATGPSGQSQTLPTKACRALLCSGPPT